ncbi:MAG: hypothetical protein AAF222_08585 [Pseudomonadota bacterium]
MLRLLSVALFLPGGAWAASPDDLSRLHEILRTDTLMEILSDEGLQESESLRDDMFPGRGGVGWTAVTGQIYDVSRMQGLFRDAFNAELADAEIAPLLAFYTGDVGARVAALEVEARRAISSEDVEAAARIAYEAIQGSGSEREALLDRFAEENGLVDRNVASALNANLAFFRGLGSGQGFEMTEDQILRDVWEQEPEIRDDTVGWVYGFMTFAYETLSDDQLQAYVELSATDAGKDLNRAFFAGFDALFLDVSFAIGAATAQFSVGDEL